VLERKDIDLIAIATPPHWHAIISIAAAQAGKDVLCEKPMTRFIAEGRAVVNAFKRYNRIFQIGTFGRFGASGNAGNVLTHKIMRSGLLKPCPAVHVKRGGLKVKEWSGDPGIKPVPVPDRLDWDLYVGPAPMKPYVPPRTGGTHRGYWDYEGGGLADMSQHSLDPVNWIYAKDETSPVEITAHAPAPHPETTGMWGWVELRFADGFTLVMDSGEWGEPYSRKAARALTLDDLAPQDRDKVQAAPDPEPLLSFAEAVKTRRQPGGRAPVRHALAPGQHRHPNRTHPPLRSRPGKDRRRRTSQSTGQSAHAGALAYLTSPNAPTRHRPSLTVNSPNRLCPTPTSEHWPNSSAIRR
jgi:hypothetical protein